MTARDAGAGRARPAARTPATPEPSLRYAGAAILLGAGLVSALATSACATLSGANSATPGTSGSARSQAPSPLGREVPGSRVRLPGTVEAGGIVEGHAPPGSIVESAVARLRVAADGRFQLAAPDAAGTMTVRIERPQPATALEFRVRVRAPRGD